MAVRRPDLDGQQLRHRARARLGDQGLVGEAGLVTVRAAGTRHVYRLNPAGLAALRDQLDTYWRRALDGYQDVLNDKTEESS